MAGHPPPEGIGDDFFEQIFSMPSSYGGAAAGGGGQVGSSSSGGLHGGGIFPLGLSLDQGKGGAAGYGSSDDGGGGQRYREDQAVAKASSSSKAVSAMAGIPLPFFHRSCLSSSSLMIDALLLRSWPGNGGGTAG